MTETAGLRSAGEGFYAFHEEAPAKTFKAHAANLWRMAMAPKNSGCWIAMNDFPAQYGGYVYFNLNLALAQRL